MRIPIVRRHGLIALIAAVVGVTLLNGSGLFLKRTGVIDRAGYERFLSKHAEGGPYDRGPLSTEQYVREEPYRTFLFRPEGAVIILKLLKDLVVLTLLVLSALCLARRSVISPIRNAWPGYLLAGSVAASFLLTAIQYGLLLPVAGLRAFSFLPLAIMLAGCCALRITLAQALATAAAVLLAV